MLVATMMGSCAILAYHNRINKIEIDLKEIQTQWQLQLKPV